MERFKALTAGVGLCIGLAMHGTSQADVVFTNFGPGYAYNTTAGNFVGNDFVGDNLAYGDTFTPTSTVTLTALQLALNCFNPGFCPDSYTVALTSNAGDQPGAVLASFTEAGTALGILGSNNPPILISTSSLQLTAGTQYWVTVTSGLTNTIVWNWNSTGDMSDVALSADGGMTWFSPSGATPGALEVDGTATVIPIPAALPLFATGIGGLGLLAWRRKRKAQAVA
jgi:hypothetical protein